MVWKDIKIGVPFVKEDIEHYQRLIWDLLSSLPEDLAEKVIEQVEFYVIGEWSLKGIYLEPSAEKHRIVIWDQGLNGSDKIDFWNWAVETEYNDPRHLQLRIILHEIAHFARKITGENHHDDPKKWHIEENETDAMAREWFWNWWDSSMQIRPPMGDDFY